MAVKTSQSATATVKLVGATEDFSDSESENELQDELRNKDVKENLKEGSGVKNDRNVIQIGESFEQKAEANEGGGSRSASTSPRKERFNPFNEDSYHKKQQFTNLRLSISPNSSHSGKLFIP